MTSHTHAWTDPYGTLHLAAGKLHLLLRHASAELASTSGPPLFTAQMKTWSWRRHRACSQESPLWLCMSRRGLLENLYTPADVAADERRSPFFFKPIVRADSNLCISLSVAFFIVLTVNHSSSTTRIRSWEQVSAMLSATSMPGNGRFQHVRGWALDWLIHFQMGVYICF